jgi:hypothetical protein
MQKTPLPRRILPWIFMLIFLVVAPALVFYTAGYRWNPKKEKVERQGTMIVDSTPQDAKIFINDKLQSKTTPLTMQNVTPGRYTIRIEKDGYSTWQKQLEVFPELVTFANNVRLWKKSEPVKTDLGALTQLSTSPNEKLLAGIQTSGTSTSLVIWNDVDQTFQTARLAQNLTAPAALTWSEDSRAILIETLTATGTSAWLANVRNQPKIFPLPAADYHWTGSDLIGLTAQAWLEINSTAGSAVKQSLGSGRVDEFENYWLQYVTGTTDLVLFSDRFQSRGLILPAGQWRFYTQTKTRLILRDHTDWLSLDPRADQPVIFKVTGDYLRAWSDRQTERFLLKHDGEIWSWNPAAQPELILRDSRRVPNVIWHTYGEDVILSTDTQVAMLNLDQRDGRLRTPLAEFERVNDLALMNKKIYVAGTRDNQSGVWTIEIE